jgi:signal transduction histidine kinase
MLRPMTHETNASYAAHEPAPVRWQPPERILGMLAHDLQIPLNAIILTAAAALRRTGDARQRAEAARVLRCAERMKRMTVDLLEFARVQCGVGPGLRPEKVDLAALAGEASREVEESHPGSRVRVEIQGDVRGEWDPGRMMQVLVNLVSNAVRHGRPGAPVNVRVARQSETVRIDVVNQSEPIPESEMSRLFEPFTRGPSCRSRGHGTGLGLFIVSELVAAHGGEVRAFNSEALTVTFSVRLPLCSPACG